MQKTLSFYESSISFEIKNTWVKQGVDKMRELAAWDSSLNSNLKIDVINKRRDTLLCRVTETNDWLKAAGISELIHDSVVFVFKNQKITNIIASSSDEQYDKIGRAVSSLYEWSNFKGDSTIYKLIKDGQFVYSSAAANEWLKLFEYAKLNDINGY